MSYEPKPTQTNAYFLQAGISFALALGALTIGIVYLPVNPWVRAFLAVSALYTVSASFTLAKTIRDAQETSRVISRVDEVRLEKFIAEHDPFAPV